MPNNITCLTKNHLNVTFNLGQAIDPAAETFKKQQLAYTLWAEQQIKNAEKQLGTAGR